MGVTARRATAFALAVLIPAMAGAPGRSGALEPLRADPPPWSVSAAASESPAVDALIALQAEVLVLVELGAFPTVPVALAAVHDSYRSYLTGIDRAGLLSWVRGSDLDGATALGQLSGAGFSLHEKTVTALQLLPEDAWAALADGRTIAIPPSVYVAALDQLNNLALGSEPPPADGDTTTTFDLTAATSSPPSTPPTVAGTIPPGTVPLGTVPLSTVPPSATPDRPGSAPSIPAPAGGGTSGTLGGATTVTGPANIASSTTARTGAVTTRTTAATRSSTGATAATASSVGSASEGLDATPEGRAAGPTPAEPGSSAGIPTGLLVALAAVLSAIAVTAGLFIASRRRNPAAQELDAVLEAGRQLASVLELGQLYPTMLGQARSLLGASHASYLARGASAEPTADTEAGGCLDGTARATIERVAETGQSWLGTLRWQGAEAAPLAVLATAVTGGGQVQGVLTVRRSADKPFRRREQARLERLAPLVATALSAAARHQALTDLTFTDALTNLANRRQLDDHVNAAVRGVDATIGFAMIDVDHFKCYNDTHGHPAGDALLRQLAALLAANVRPDDVVYRYGGEEFAILLPGADQRVAAEVGERVRNAIHVADLPGGSTQPNGRVTVSVGIAVGPTVDAESLKGQADRSLYEAKRAGRDRVVVAPDRR